MGKKNKNYNNCTNRRFDSYDVNIIHDLVCTDVTTRLTSPMLAKRLIKLQIHFGVLNILAPRLSRDDTIFDGWSYDGSYGQVVIGVIRSGLSIADETRVRVCNCRGGGRFTPTQLPCVPDSISCRVRGTHREPRARQCIAGQELLTSFLTAISVIIPRSKRTHHLVRERLCTLPDSVRLANDERESKSLRNIMVRRTSRTIEITMTRILIKSKLHKKSALTINIPDVKYSKKNCFLIIYIFLCKI